MVHRAALGTLLLFTDLAFGGVHAETDVQFNVATPPATFAADEPNGRFHLVLEATGAIDDQRFQIVGPDGSALGRDTCHDRPRANGSGTPPLTVVRVEDSGVFVSRLGPDQNGTYGSSPEEFRLVDCAPIATDTPESIRQWLLWFEFPSSAAVEAGQRYLRVTWNDITSMMGYPWLGSVTASLDLTLAGAEIAIKPGDSIPMTLAVNGPAATNVSLQVMPLIEQTSRRLINNTWRLCHAEVGGTGTSECEPVTFLAGNRIYNLRLSLEDNQTETFPIGDYVGAIRVWSAEDPDGDGDILKIFGTTNHHFWDGVLLIFLGVIISWVVTVFLRNRLAWAQALRSAARLRERIGPLKLRLANAVGDLRADGSDTQMVLSNLKKNLSDRRLVLTGRIPAGFPVPFTDEFSHADYEDYLAKQRGWIDLMAVLVLEGFERVRAQEHAITRDSTERIIGSLNEIVKPYREGELPDPPAIEEIRTKITEIFSRTAPLAAIASRMPETISDLGDQTLSDIHFSIQQTSWIMWGTYLLLTTTFGTHVLIYQDPGFGTMPDYLVCFLWGFGLPAGATLAGAAPSTVRTWLGLKWPSTT